MDNISRPPTLKPATNEGCKMKECGVGIVCGMTLLMFIFAFMFSYSYHLFSKTNIWLYMKCFAGSVFKHHI
jgi:hypothetical protein